MTDKELNTNLVHANPSTDRIDRGDGRDKNGRLLPGHSGNKSGVSKHAKEVKEMAAHIVNNVGWDRLIERLNDPKTPAVVVVQIFETLYAIAHGKPGIRKEDQGLTVDDMKAMIPSIVFTNTDKLKELGINLQDNKSGEQADKDPE